ncbi:Cytochrome c1 heme lyase [Scheffersomyces spartinae]|uniref:Holocytochrome c-type synthase n=1 Tax=Scheffersomyces spartinae TaxID=45513 RepID=A0A9P7V702_9ASCO|nr:Cytochrome c1 heme lyase [Scheffersomyces spartinae]KAG7192361.1 Cytochrome c1 heme lyase [Scheffersomyces spartinae]
MSDSTDSNEPRCPVDTSKWGSLKSKCPVPHNAREEWLRKVSVTVPEAIEVSDKDNCNSDRFSNTLKDTTTSKVDLPIEREISLIPRTLTSGNWIYPSQKQFFEAMQRKNWNPEAQDMKTVVPIHNMVNEMAWQHILNWEQSYHEETVAKCGGITLSSFKGDATKLTPRAWIKANVFQMDKPFDRHDWKVDRCGVSIEYVIDFYTVQNANGKPGFFLDVRPKLNSWEGIKLRGLRAMGMA